jgi:ATP-dependent DNA helicase RecG
MYEESQFIELKEKVTKDLKKEIVAFANSNDGTIYIGIKDDGTIIGVKNAKKDIEAISSIIHDNIKPDLTLNIKLYTEKINN